MTIKNGKLIKKLVLYPLAQTIVGNDFPIWVEEEEDEKFC